MRDSNLRGMLQTSEARVNARTARRELGAPGEDLHEGQLARARHDVVRTMRSDVAVELVVVAPRKRAFEMLARSGSRAARHGTRAQRKPAQLVRAYLKLVARARSEVAMMDAVST